MSLWKILRPNRPASSKSGPPLAVGQIASPQTANASIDDGRKFKGFTEHLTPTPFIDLLPDWQLEELNSILKWNCFTVDSNGRRFGNVHSSKKRQIPQMVPDNRIVLMDKQFNLKEKVVLEVGCFEGVHTTALAQRAKSVVAIDSRIENVVKTMVRVGCFAQQAKVLCCNVEELAQETKSYLRADLVHHVGVLYHLKDPVTHLKALKDLAPLGMMLDTHYATDEMATRSYEVDGEAYRYFHYSESKGYKGVFSGMYDHAKWLHIEDLHKALRLAGYPKIDLIETRQERNGPRLLLFAQDNQ